MTMNHTKEISDILQITDNHPKVIFERFQNHWKSPENAQIISRVVCKSLRITKNHPKEISDLDINDW